MDNMISDELKVDKYVAFLDVLGFKELVNRGGPPIDEYFNTILTALHDIQLDKPTIEFQMVSDSTILSCDISDSNLRLLIRAIQTIQIRCALKNHWIRGAVSIGGIYISNSKHIVVGTGLSRAYLLESQEKFPRVIIDPKIISLKFETGNNFINVCNGTSGDPSELPLIHDIRNESKYINTNTFFVSFGPRLILEDPNNIDIVYSHIKSELYKSQSVYEKYYWLKKYFTEVTETFNWELLEKGDGHHQAIDHIFRHVHKFMEL